MLEPFVYCPPISPLDILFQDKDMVVVNKPSGLLTNPGRGSELADCLLSRVQAHFPTALLVHRLDLSTSGIVVFALRRNAERELKRQFAERLVKKRYLAVVAGYVQQASGTITLPLRANPDKPPTHEVHAEGKAAETAYTLLAQREKDGLQSSLVELKPVTGRSHQLRVHMAALGHPILGDAFYAPIAVKQAAPRLLLHAATLTLHQPYHQHSVTFNADTDFVTASNALLLP